MKFTIIMAAFALILATPVFADNFETASPPKLLETTEKTASTTKSLDQKVETATIKAIAFHSDNCGSCKVLGPRMMQAVEIINPTKIEMVKFDLTNKKSIEETKTLADQKGVSEILQKFGAKTGFAVLVNSDGTIVDTLKVDHDTGEIASKLAIAIADAS